jgi:hypothetical protein
MIPLLLALLLPGCARRLARAGLVLAGLVLPGCAALGEAFLQTGVLIQCGPAPTGPSSCGERVEPGPIPVCLRGFTNDHQVAQRLGCRLDGGTR